MDSDSILYRLFQRLPQTFFELIGMPGTRPKWYRFDSVELKKALRIDGVFLPKRRKLPVYFVEMQFQRVPTFHANLFAKVFCYLEENDPSRSGSLSRYFPAASRSRDISAHMRICCDRSVSNEST